jgi:WD40 repeat protein
MVLLQIDIIFFYIFFVLQSKNLRNKFAAMIAFVAWSCFDTFVLPCDLQRFLVLRSPADTACSFAFVCVAAMPMHKKPSAMSAVFKRLRGKQRSLLAWPTPSHAVAAKPQTKRGKLPDAVSCCTMHICILSMTGAEILKTNIGTGATLGQLRAQVAAAIAPASNVKLFLVFAGRILSETDGIMITDLGIADGTALTLVKERVGRVATASLDCTSKIWSAGSGQCLLSLEGHEAEVLSIAFSPDGTSVVTASLDNTAKIWSTSSGECLLTFYGHEESVNSAAFSPDGTLVVTASCDETAKIWSSTSGECLDSLEGVFGHEACVNTATFSPDGVCVVTTSDDDTAKTWRLGEYFMATFDGHENRVMTAEFSADGAWVLTASCDKTAKIWHAASGKCRVILEGHTDEVCSATFSPDGASVATTSTDRTAKIWSTSSGECLRTFENVAHFAKFSPDGAFMIVASQKAKMLCATSGKCILEFEGHVKQVSSAAFYA